MQTMQIIVPLVCFGFGLAIAGVLARILMKSEVEQASERIRSQTEAEKAVLIERLKNEQRAAEEKLALLDEAQQKLSDAFKALSADALKSNNQAFLDLAKASLETTQEGAKGELEKREQAIAELVKPVRETLEKFDFKIQELEKARVGAYESLTQQVRSLQETQVQLRSETGKLVTALRAPTVRGQWGEIQLKRVVELAGMVNHCDFNVQQSVTTENGRLRPDLVVYLPGKKHIVIDAKAPLEAYLKAIEAPDEETRKANLRDHARQIRDHMAALARKAYWDQFQPTPEFVVLFLPGECFFSAALENDPTLIETGIDRPVILATPTTLIALLRAVAYGWRQESIAQNAQDISHLGAELYKRLSSMGGHWIKLGKQLDSAVDSYNDAVGSLESRVMVAARRFADLETTPTGAEIPDLKTVEKSTRAVQSSELLGLPELETVAALEAPAAGESASEPPVEVTGTTEPAAPEPNPPEAQAEETKEPQPPIQAAAAEAD